MYWQHFGLEIRPFGASPGAGGPYMSASHRTAVALLEHSVHERRGVVVVFGEAGTGKSVLLRHLTGRLGARVAVAFIVDPLPRFGSILGRVLLALGIDAAEANPLVMIDQFHLLNSELAKGGKRILIVIDEGQVLGTEQLEELRMLSNVGDADFMPQIVLGGQPIMRDTLRRPEMTQFAQRVIAECELRPLDCLETQAYIEFRLAAAGAGQRVIFDRSACLAVHEFTHGVPRLVDTLCEGAMIYGGLAGRDSIDACLVTDMARDRLRGGILPIGSRTAIAAAGHEGVPVSARVVAS